MADIKFLPHDAVQFCWFLRIGIGYRPASSMIISLSLGSWGRRASYDKLCLSGIATRVGCWPNDIGDVMLVFT
jgi:hypothetical protein